MPAVTAASLKILLVGNTNMRQCTGRPLPTYTPSTIMTASNWSMAAETGTCLPNFLGFSDAYTAVNSKYGLMCPNIIMRSAAGQQVQNFALKPKAILSTHIPPPPPSSRLPPLPPPTPSPSLPFPLCPVPAGGQCTGHSHRASSTPPAPSSLFSLSRPCRGPGHWAFPLCQRHLSTRVERTPSSLSFPLVLQGRLITWVILDAVDFNLHVSLQSYCADQNEGGFEIGMWKLGCGSGCGN